MRKRWHIGREAPVQGLLRISPWGLGGAWCSFLGLQVSWRYQSLVYQDDLKIHHPGVGAQLLLQLCKEIQRAYLVPSGAYGAVRHRKQCEAGIRSNDPHADDCGWHKEVGLSPRETGRRIWSCTVILKAIQSTGSHSLHLSSDWLRRIHHWMKHSWSPFYRTQVVWSSPGLVWKCSSGISFFQTSASPIPGGDSQQEMTASTLQVGRAKKRCKGLISLREIVDVAIGLCFVCVCVGCVSGGELV